MFTATLHISFFFFFNDTATTEIYTLSLHDALPISVSHSIRPRAAGSAFSFCTQGGGCQAGAARHNSLTTSWKRDRKSTRLNSSHSQISYAVFCLKKKKKHKHYKSLHSTTTL